MSWNYVRWRKEETEYFLKSCGLGPYLDIVQNDNNDYYDNENDNDNVNVDKELQEVVECDKKKK